MRILLCTLTACTIGVSAIAQAQSPSTQTPSNQTPSTEAAPTSASAQWRASKLMDINVYNNQNEKLGEIEELIIEPSGRIVGVVLEVGGFLGMGERNVMVPLDQLKFGNESGTSTTGTSADNKQHPDRAVMDASKDQLKAMPEFK